MIDEPRTYKAWLVAYVARFGTDPLSFSVNGVRPSKKSSPGLSPKGTCPDALGFDDYIFDKKKVEWARKQ